MMNALITRGLSLSERAIYVYIVGRGNGAHLCWPSVQDIMDDLEISRRTALNGTKKLASLGLLRIQRRYKDTNNYFVLDRPGMYDTPAYPSSANRPLYPPDVIPDPREVQNLTPETADPEVQNPTPIGVPQVQESPVLGAESDGLGCKERQSEVQELTLPSSYQVSYQESIKQAARARDEGIEVVLLSPNASADEIWAVGGELGEGWTWSRVRHGWVKQRPMPKTTAAHIAAMNAIGTPDQCGGLKETVYKACEIVGIDIGRATQKDFSVVRSWLNDGKKPEEIFNAIADIVKRQDYRGAYSLAYFDKPVRYCPKGGRRASGDSEEALR